MNNNPAQRPADVSDELAWSAFRFVAGEMAADELADFEARLADDQAAREAVAEAVEIFHAVCAVEAAEPVVAVAAKQRSTWSQKVAWVASGAAAAAIVVAVGLNVGSLTRVFSPTPEPAVATVSPALADAWSLVRSEFASVDDSNSDTEEALSPMAIAAEPDGEDLAFSTEAPSWMTAGVLGLSARDMQPENGATPPQEN